MSGSWTVTIPPTPGIPRVEEAGGALVATLHGPRTQAALDAILVAHAPAMLGALAECCMALEVMAAQDPGPSGALAARLLERLRPLLDGPLSAWESH